MCGIVGFAGDVPEGKWRETYDVLNAMILASEHRGTDATGFVALTSPFKNQLDQNVVTDKQPMRASLFVEENQAWRSLYHRRCSLVLAHVRWETHGTSENSENLHPHEGTSGLFLVHNGIVVDHVNAAERYGLDLRGDCDSEILIRELERYENPVHGLNACLDHFTGSMAIAVFDHRKECLWLARNASRPLWVGKLKGDTRWWVASTRP